MSDVRDAGYDDFLDALEEGEGYYLECDEGHGWLPPRTVCPVCGDDLEERPLPESGTVDTYTETHVSMPSFTEETPYVVAIADFGPVRITGQLRGVDDPAVGLTVEPTVEERGEGERLLCLRPR